MTISRREFVKLLGIAGAAGMLPRSVFATMRQPSDLYEVPKFGNVSILHITDVHAQLNPIYFREPNVNLGIGSAFGKAPHLVGQALLKHFGIPAGGIEAHAFTYLDFDKAATKYGMVGGFAHLKTLVKRVRDSRGPGNSLLLDGGDTWQGSGTAYWTRGRDMVGACNLLGVDVMTGHWEFTYLDKDAAFAEYRDLFEEDSPELVDAVTPEVLPTSFKVKPANPEPEVVDALVQQFTGQSGV